METWRSDPINKTCYRFKFCPNAQSNGWHRCSGYCAVHYGRGIIPINVYGDHSLLPKVRHPYYRHVLLCLKLYGEKSDPISEDETRTDENGILEMTYGNFSAF